MGLIKAGCMGIIIISATIGVAVYMLENGDTKVPEIKTSQQIEEKKESPDPVKLKFGLSEDELKRYADQDVKFIVRQHLNLGKHEVISSWNNDLKFWEYELYDKDSKEYEKESCHSNNNYCFIFWSVHACPVSLYTSV